MGARMTADSDAIRDVGVQVNSWAATLQSTPHTLRPSLSTCGSSVVPHAGSVSEDQFRIQALVIETELRDIADAAQRAASALETWDALGVEIGD